MLNKKFISLIIICIFILGSCTGNDKGPVLRKVIAKNGIIKTFNENINKFSTVSNYLKQIKGDVSIKEDVNGEIIYKTVENNRVIIFEIKNEEVTNDINYIIKTLNYINIDKYRTNGIYFYRQTGFAFGQGIAFSTNGETPDWGLISEIEKINDNWYYFKESEQKETVKKVVYDEWEMLLSGNNR